MFSKKKTYGHDTKKQRTIEEINQDYNFHAAQAGHKGRVIRKIENEIEDHLERLEQIDQEAKALPPASVKSAESPEEAPKPEEPSDEHTQEPA